MMMLTCVIELPSSYAELNAVFDVYDVTLSGHINYRELVKTVDRQVGLLTANDGLRRCLFTAVT